MRAKKDMLKKKKTTMRVPSSNAYSESDSESYQSSSSNSDSNSSSSSNSESDYESDSGSDSEHAVYVEPQPQQEIRSKKKNDRAVVGSNVPLNITQQSVVVAEFSKSEDTPLAVAFENINKKKKQQRKNRNTKQRVSQINEGDEVIQEAERSASETRMFDSFETISLGRDDSDNVVVEGPFVVPSQPSQKEKEHIQPGQPSKSQDAEVSPPRVEDVVQEKIQPEPLVVIMPLQPEQQSRGNTEDPSEPTEVEPEPINMQIPFETPDPEPCSLTLRPWLQPEAKSSAAKGPMESADEMITHVLFGMNQEGPSTQDGNQIQQPEDQDQCKTPETAPVSLKERCFIWARMENNSKYEMIFELRGPNTIEAMRYNFMTMGLETCIDMQMIRMFETYGTNYLDKETKMPYLVSQLKDQQYMELLDKEKLRKHSTLFVPVLYSHHWWLYVLDVDNKEFYIVDSVFGITTNQQRSKLHRFACNTLNQLRVWAGTPSLLKKQTITLQLRCVDNPKQPNPTDCGVYVMKWMELLDAAALSAAYTFKLRYSIEEWSQDQLDQFRKEIVSKLIMSKDITLNVEAINQAMNMTPEAITEAKTKMGGQPKPSAALKSPYLQVSTTELEKKH
ncbi:hypothetical protein PIB30_085272 [Stylosanthes scabra]|uniref:Ubiquitin-like protease family profile domain-containing protein n=1 Tax=Stylosanthes scabra TaxID=79078 RepID=A0ABU6YQC7_9FABA|nr:hypothetical protein [Stylosanthes scabra]